MNWLVDNWYLAVAGLALLAFVIYCIYTFFGMPTEKQIAKVKEWLIWACIEAERALQSGTGQLKLRQVYDAFCSVPAFTWIAKVISFDTFTYWVSDALLEVKLMLISNENLAEYVYGNGLNADAQIKKLKEQLGV
jgi:amino acid permease